MRWERKGTLRRCGLAWGCALVFAAAGLQAEAAEVQERTGSPDDAAARAARFTFFRGDLTALGARMILFAADLPLPGSSDPAEVRFLESMREGLAEAVRFAQASALIAELGIQSDDPAAADEKLMGWIGDGRRMMESRRKSLDLLAREVAARTELAEKLAEFKSILAELEAAVSRMDRLDGYERSGN